MGVEGLQTRNLIDLTGVILKPNDVRVIQLPRIKKGIDQAFLDDTVNAIEATRGLSYERFAHRLFGKGNPFLKAFFDQELHWEVLNKHQIDKLLNENENPVEKFAKSWMGQCLRDPNWMPRWMRMGVTVIDLDEFYVDLDKVSTLIHAKQAGEKNTIVSGNSYWSRRPLVRKLGEETTKMVDPDLGIILPPYFRVPPVKLKVSSALWCRDGANKETVIDHEDDYPLALLMSIVCDKVIMPVNEHSAKNQPYTEEIIKESGLVNLIREDRVEFT